MTNDLRKWDIVHIGEPAHLWRNRRTGVTARVERIEDGIVVMHMLEDPVVEVRRPVETVTLTWRPSDEAIRHEEAENRRLYDKL